MVWRFQGDRADASPDNVSNSKRISGDTGLFSRTIQVVENGPNETVTNLGFNEILLFEYAQIAVYLRGTMHSRLQKFFHFEKY